MAAEIEIKYFNTFILKNALDTVEYNAQSVWNGSFGIPEVIGGYPRNAAVQTPAPNNNNWFIEEARIRGGYNNTIVDLGVRAYIVDEDNTANTRNSSLIYSGIYNSRTGINQTNEFSVAEDITKSADPANGSIQKLYAEDTNLIMFQESKVSRALIDKDAIYSAEGSPITTSGNVVIGQIQSYAGNYGISKDPLSFAVYGYRKYFTDRFRGAVLRLSQDGITEISSNGMTDFFRDEFVNIDSAPHGAGLVIGGWDIHNKQYVLSLQRSYANPDKSYYTVVFDESSLGFTGFFTYNPSQIVSIKNSVYTVNNGILWNHYSNAVNNNTFYGIYNKSSITFIFNPNPNVSKNFKTISYEGDNGWQLDNFESDSQQYDFSNQFEANPPTPVIPFLLWNASNNWLISNDVVALIPSYLGGAYDALGNTYPSTLNPPIYRYGFERKENKYYANLVNASSSTSGEVIWGNDISGIKGRYATVTLSTDTITNLGGPKKLWSVGSEYVISSY
jgi:hypothetical protein